jgi:hypothetical protein
VTGDELAAAVYAKYGYLTLQLPFAVDIGYLLHPSGDDSGQTETIHFRVIGPSNYQEWEAQRQYCEQITSDRFQRDAFYDHPHYYRCEACD